MGLNTKKVIVFDLDDTLYNEIDFLKSAYLEISDFIANTVKSNNNIVYNNMLGFYDSKENCFEKIIEKYSLPITTLDLLNMYRSHKPNLVLSPDRLKVLNYIKEANVNMCILTDGRSEQQRNKIKALGIENYFSEIIISEEFGSEKPHLNNYRYFETVFGAANYYYIGDNVKKDFVTPNRLGWTTICLKDKGLNIHDQNMGKVQEDYLAQYTIEEFSEIIDLLR